MKILWDQSYQYDDIRYEQGNKDAKGIVRIVINRPHLRNAFRPKTIIELKDAFEKAREDSSCGVIILTGEGPDAFCSGGDQKVRGDAGYVGKDGVPRLNVLDLQRTLEEKTGLFDVMVAILFKISWWYAVYCSFTSASSGRTKSCFC